MRNIKYFVGAAWLGLAFVFLYPSTIYRSQPAYTQSDSTFDITLIDTLRKAVQSTGALSGNALLIDTEGSILSSVGCTGENYEHIPECGKDLKFADSRWEPGSVFKPILTALMLDNGYITPKDTFYDTGMFMIDGYRIDNVTPDEGKEYSVIEFLGTSRNTGAVTILKRLESNENPMGAWSKMVYGISADDQTHLPNFAEVRNPTHRFYESSYGVGITISPLELSRIYASFIYYGKKCNSSGNCNQIFKKETADYIKRALYTVASGYADVISKNSECVFGGKSGTALNAHIGGVYEQSKNNGTYIGYIDNPDKEVVLLMRLEEPSDELASRPTRYMWVDTANDLCLELANK